MHGGGGRVRSGWVGQGEEPWEVSPATDQAGWPAAVRIIATGGSSRLAFIHIDTIHSKGGDIYHKGIKIAPWNVKKILVTIIDCVPQSI